VDGKRVQEKVQTDDLWAAKTIITSALVFFFEFFKNK
jgi:hypothetical protein